MAGKKGQKSGGHNRKPVAKLRLHGSYREDRHRERFDDSLMQDGPEKPADMVDLAQRLWDRVVPQLETAGLAKAVDEYELRGMCEWWARYLACSAWLRHRQTREAFDGDAATVALIAKIQRMAQGAWDEFSRSASKFGLSPRDRAGLMAEEKSDSGEFDKDLQKHA